MCMNQVENKELNDKNVDEFFNRIDCLSGQMNDTKNNDMDKQPMEKNDRIMTNIQYQLISLFIYLQNVRYLRNKNHDIKPKTFDTLYDIIALTETFFDDGNLDEEHFCDKFSVFRCDRSLANGAKS